MFRSQLWQAAALWVTALGFGFPVACQSRCAAADDLSDAQALQVLQTYCYDCHVGDGAEGGIEVDFFEGDSNELGDYVEVVEKMIRVMKESEMPPADSEQPSQEERVRALEWVERQLASFDCGTISAPGRVTMRRLNRVEYDNTIRDLTGLDLQLAKDFPSDDVGNGFDNIGDVLTIPPILFEKYVSAAIAAASAVTQDEASLRRVFPLQVGVDGDVVEVARKNAKHFATRAFRRPVTEEESQRLFELMRKAYETGASSEEIQQRVVAAVLSSPHFIYKVESDRPQDFVDGQRALNDYELATRLSYFLWSSMPDERLFQLAEQGALGNEEQLVAEVDRMLDDPKAAALVDNFAGQWLQLRDLETLSPDPETFQDFDSELRQAMRRETELLFSRIVSENRSILDLLSADYTFVNERLAQHYGLDGIEGDSFRQVSVPNRSGVLTHASILLITSNPTRTSPVKRGKWILDNLLGEPPPPPPPDVPELGESGEALGTLRQQMEQHRANPNCAVCHTKMDALGFGLENFDGIGRWREADGRDSIDPSGVLPSGREFQGPVDLVAILAEDKKSEFTRCLTRKLLTYALGRGLGVADRCTVNTIVDRVAGNDYQFRTMVKAIVTSPPFTIQQADD